MPRTGTQAKVEEHPTSFVGRSPEALIAEFENQMVTTEEVGKGEDGTPVTTTHKRPGTTVMYKPTEGQGYVPRTVAGSAMSQLLRQGWKEFCPDCGKHHLDKQGKHSPDPNLCDGRNPVAVRVCPVCAKRIYDNIRFEKQAIEQGDDVNVIIDEDYENSTGATRTRASLDLHLWARHARQAQMMGIPPVPTALREIVEEPK